MMQRKCPNCSAELPNGKRVYCSRFCQITYYNKKYRPVYRRDKWGREYLDCGKCGRRLKKLEYTGRTRFICLKCHKTENHKQNKNSTFMRRVFQKGNKKLEVILEITQNNRNWHYLNGHPVQSLKKVINSFRAKCHTLTDRDRYKEIIKTN